MIFTPLTALLYPLAIQYKKGGWYNLLKPFALCVFCINVIANYTELSLIFGFPKKGDWTISERVKTMQQDLTIIPAANNFAWRVQEFLDAFEPDGKH